MEFRRLPFLPIILFIILLFMQYRLWFDAGGLRQIWQMKKQLAVARSENEQIKQGNQALMLQIHQLHQNQDAIESRARHELGMVKKGETFYQLVE